MKIKRKTYVFITVLTFALSYGQREIYLDENLKSIDSTLFSKKCQSQIFKCLSYKKDSLNINTILYKFSFGRLNQTEYAQIKSLLSQRASDPVESESVLIVFKDSLMDYTASEKQFRAHIKACEKSHKDISGGVRHPEYTEKYHKQKDKKISKMYRRCETKFEKNNLTTIFYAYRHDSGYVENHPELKWIKDNGSIKNTFFKIMKNYRFVLLKSDGEYFLGGSCLSNKKLNQLLKASNWDKFKQDFSSSLKPINSFGVGFFKKQEHQTHCF